jgi:hypothetical protein
MHKGKQKSTNIEVNNCEDGEIMKASQVKEDRARQCRSIDAQFLGAVRLPTQVCDQDVSDVAKDYGHNPCCPLIERLLHSSLSPAFPNQPDSGIEFIHNMGLTSSQPISRRTKPDDGWDVP